MDTIGSISDPSIRIAASEKLLHFLKAAKAADDCPDFIKGILKNKRKNTNQTEVDIRCQLKTEDYEKIKEIAREFPNSPKKDEKIEENKVDDDSEAAKNEKEENKVNDDSETAKKEPPHYYLTVGDAKKLYLYLEEKRKQNEDTVYLHELLEGCDIILPENDIIPRNPELEARCEKLRKDQSNRDYRAMTKNVDNVRVRHPEESIASQMKQLNRQLIAIFQFIMSVAAGFFFGFLGIQMMVGSLDFGFRLLLGVIFALVIALAEIYFLAKKLNEDLIITETVQLGGPTIFPDTKKPHQD